MNKNSSSFKGCQRGYIAGFVDLAAGNSWHKKPRMRKAFVWCQGLTLPVSEDMTISNQQQEHPAVFNARFARCRALLYFVACRVLGSNEGAEDAVQSCWLTSSRNPPKFEYEGAFRSWLVRILIDEALAVLRKKKESTRA